MSTRFSQKGAALLVFILILIVTSGLILFTYIKPDDGRVSSENTTSSSLASAKQALIAYAVSYYFTARNHAGHHGFLPCPETADSTDEGRSVLNCAIGGSRYVNQLGRLPWKTLQIAALTDASGECLWYAMSGSFSPGPRAEMLNDDTPGMFQLYQQNGQLLKGATPEDRVIAVIIAPGTQLAHQHRAAATAGTPCKRTRQQLVSTDYLETYQGISNSSINNTIPDQVDRFITADGLAINPSINDRIITISANEVFDAIKRNQSYYTDRLEQLGLALGNCLITYAQTAAGCSCYNSCRDAFNICDASNPTGTAHASCVIERNACFRNCRPGCRAGKGVGNPALTSLPLLPWPAAVDLKSDYRRDESYDDLPAAGEGYLGRLPDFINDSASTMMVTDNSIFDSCHLVDAPEYHHLWQNWKDHWFYVVGKDFAPGGSADINCNNCPSVSSTRYAALLIFSGERINAQLRRSNETETPDPPFVDSKADINNYLEGSNATNYPDSSGNGDYGVNNMNDRLFCITTDLSDVIECTP